MRKDYAKTKNKVTPKQPPRHSKKSNLEGRLWLIVCVLIALFIAGLIFLKHEGAKMAMQQATQQPKTAKVTVDKPAVPQPRFDFYTMLPSVKVAPPTSGAQSLSTRRQFESNTDKATPADTDKRLANANLPPTAREQIANLEKQELDAVSRGETKATTTVVPEKKYSLQLGLFNDFAKADELKAQLVLQGVEAKIKSFKKNGVTWYRVWLGPYKTSAQAEKMQQKIKAEQIKSIIITS